MMEIITFSTMPEEQLSALLAKLKEDVELQEKLKGAGDLDAAVAIAKDAGFDVSKADWLKYQAKQTLELSDEELEVVAGGSGGGGSGGTGMLSALLSCNCPTSKPMGC
jgi:predicted ribosomally synthesized peptide with nif11-like leader